MLGRFVIAAADLPAGIDLPFAVLANEDHSRAAAIESKQIVSSSKPSYCEVAIDQLDAVKEAGSFAKIRTGGVTPESIPSVDALAEFITACANRRLPFKATAGLHHAIRGPYALTYEPGAPIATMHGFVNVFVAATFAWAAYPLRPILEETDPGAFQFDDGLQWRGLSLSRAQIEDCRENFLHSFGSCSFEEPIADLKNFGWL